MQNMNNCIMKCYVLTLLINNRHETRSNVSVKLCRVTADRFDGFTQAPRTAMKLVLDQLLNQPSHFLLL